ncbi:MAG: 3-oxoacid CoA-transferase subunit B [Chloroflexota bacterium]|nr:3-oxoacid CoA-transferase subunit B [Chloroflexota bacterium]
MEDKFKLDRETMALRVAKEFQDGNYVNLGIGIPVLAANYIPVGREVVFQSENGILGFGEITTLGEGDPDLVNAGGQTVRPAPGMSAFDHAESFTMIRGGHLDISVMGGFQVSEKGDLANYMVPERKIGSIGGAMDLAVGAKRLIVVMNHVTKDGKPRVVRKCTYHITAIESVNLLVTDIAVIEITDNGLVLKEVAPGWTPEEVQSLTEPTLIVDPDCHEIELM